MPAKDRLDRLKHMREERKSNTSTPQASEARDQYARMQQEREGSQLLPPLSNAGAFPPATLGLNTSAHSRSNSSAANGYTTSSNNQKDLSVPPKYKKTPTPLIPVPLEGRQKDLWATMAQQAQYDYEQKLLRERKEHAAKMAEQKKFLDSQVASRDERRAQYRQTHLDERPVTDAAHQQWLEENDDKLQARKRQIKAIGEDRASQIDHRNRRRAEEKEAARAADKAILANIEVMNEQAKARQAAATKRKEEMKDVLIAANEDLKRRLEDTKSEEAAFEERIVEGMKLKEMRDHEARTREAAAFNEKVKGREAMAMKLQATLAQKSQADEEKANKEAVMRLARDDERQVQIKAQKEKDKQAILKIRAFQVEERRIAREEAAFAKERELKQISEQHRLEREKAYRELQLQRAKLEQQRLSLDEQIDERHHYQFALVSAEEKKINAPILQRAEKDSSHHTPLPYTAPGREGGYKNRESSSKMF